MEATTNKRKKVTKILKSWSPIFIVIILGLSFFAVYKFSFDSGQLFVANHIREKVSIVANLSSSEIQSKMKEYFPEKMNYTELFTWQSTKMNYSQNRDYHTDPLEILDYGKGACLEYAVVYVASCLVNDIPARLLGSGYVIPGQVDHAWAEVNPSRDGKTWIHIEPADCAVSIQNGKSVSELKCFNNPSMHYNKHIELVLAFEPTPDGGVIIRDRTEYYSPNQ